MNSIKIDQFKKNVRISIILSFLLVYIFPLIYMEIEGVNTLFFFGVIELEPNEYFRLCVYIMAFCVYLSFTYSLLDFKSIAIHYMDKIIYNIFLFILMLVSLMPGIGLIAYFVNFLFLSFLVKLRISFLNIIYLFLVTGVVDLFVNHGRWMLVNSLVLLLIYKVRSISVISLGAFALLFFSNSNLRQCQCA